MTQLTQEHTKSDNTPRADVWNPMVKLMNEHPDKDVRDKAKMLLGQYKTAGGNQIKHELEYMLQEHGY